MRQPGEGQDRQRRSPLKKKGKTKPTPSFKSSSKFYNAFRGNKVSRIRGSSWARETQRRPDRFDGSGWRPGRHGRRYRLRAYWCSKKCSTCGKVRYVWPVLRLQICGRKIDRSGWWVRSRSVPIDKAVSISNLPFENGPLRVRCCCLRKWPGYSSPPAID